jgi:glutaredoxin
MESPVSSPVASAHDVVLEGAYDQVEVTMYAAPWCTVCDRARGFLRERGVSLVEYNVDADARALKRLGKLAPAGALPTFQIAGETLIGFDPNRLDRHIDEVALGRYAARRD